MENEQKRGKEVENREAKHRHMGTLNEAKQEEEMLAASEDQNRHAEAHIQIVDELQTPK